MVALLLLGCTTTVRFPPDLWVWEPFDTADTGLFDTGVSIPPGELGKVGFADSSCDPAGTVWLLEVTSVGWTNGARFWMAEADTHIEEHPMLLVDSDPQGRWDRYLAGPLTAGVDSADYDAAINSEFACALEPDLSFGTVLVDRFGVVSDCRVWGPDAAGLRTHIESIEPGAATLGCTAL